MASIEELKATAEAAIDRRRDWLIEVAQTVLRNPEPGFQEVKTARLVSEKLTELGIAHEDGIALTGIKGYLRAKGPVVSIVMSTKCLLVKRYTQRLRGGRQITSRSLGPAEN